MGIVYEAQHAKTNNRVALKTLPTGGDGQQVNADKLYRFRKEFRRLSEINHPNLVGMQSLEVDRDHWFFTMDLIDGVRNRRRMKSTGRTLRGNICLRRIQMEKAMQIELPQELEPFIEQEFATGRYASRNEVVVQALRWLQEERQQAVSGIKQGLDDAAAGRTQPIGEAFSDIRREFGVPETE